MSIRSRIISPQTITNSSHTFEEAILQFEVLISDQVATSYDQVKKYLVFMDFVAKPAYDKLIIFYTSAVANLKQLSDMVKNPETNAEVINTFLAIMTYIQKEKSIIPRNFGGILAYTDKSYIIHAQLMKLHVARHIKMSDFPHNSSLIFAVVNVLVLILGHELIKSMAYQSEHLMEEQYFSHSGNDIHTNGFTEEIPFRKHRFFEDEMAETAAKLGGFGDINFYQSPSYD